MKSFLQCIGMVFLFFARLGFASEVIDFKQSLETAFNKSIDYKIAENELVVSRKKKAEALRALLPSISIKLAEETKGELTDSKYIRKSRGIELKQPIFQGGKLRYTYKQTAAEYKAAKQNLEKTRFDIEFNVASLFYNTLKFKKTLDEYEDITTEITNQMVILEEQNNKNYIAKLDYEEAKDEYKELLFNKSQMKDQMELSLLELKHELGISYKDKINIKGSFSSKYNGYEIDDLVSSMFKNHPEIKSAEESLNASEYGKKAGEALFSPSLEFEGYYNDTDEALRRDELAYEDDWYAGLKVKIPLWGSSITSEMSKSEAPGNTANTESKDKESYVVKFNVFDSLADYTKKAEAILHNVNKEKELDDVKKKYLLEVHKVYLQYKSLRMQFHRAVQRKNMRRKKVELVKYQVCVQKAKMIELLQEYAKLFEAVKEYWDTAYEYEMAGIKLERLGGEERNSKGVIINETNA